MINQETNYGIAFLRRYQWGEISNVRFNEAANLWLGNYGFNRSKIHYMMS